MNWSWTHYSYDPPTQDQVSKTSQYSTASSTNLTEWEIGQKEITKRGYWQC